MAVKRSSSLRLIIVASGLLLIFMIFAIVGYNPQKARGEWFKNSVKSAIPEYDFVSVVVTCDTLRLTSGKEIHLEKINCSDDLFQNKKPILKNNQQEMEYRSQLKQDMLQFIKTLVENKKVGLRFNLKNHDNQGRPYVSVYPLDKDGDFMYGRQHPDLAGYFANSKLEIIELNASLILKGYAIPDISSQGIMDMDYTLRLYRFAQEKMNGVWKYFIAPEIK